LREAYLFGSRVKNPARRESDTDIAALLPGRSRRRTDTVADMAGIAFDVMPETGILVDAIPFWEVFETENFLRLRSTGYMKNYTLFKDEIRVFLCSYARPRLPR